MAATDAQKNELRDKVGKLVSNRFGGDYHDAFDYYDGDVKDGKISGRELSKLLADAGVGNWLTRGAWASGIIAELDTDKDGTISKAEFEGVLNEAPGRDVEPGCGRSEDRLPS
ncbi:MAG: EF-hand domain-containing protein [Gemmataceae bacterium]